PPPGSSRPSTCSPSPPASVPAACPTACERGCGRYASSGSRSPRARRPSRRSPMRRSRRSSRRSSSRAFSACRGTGSRSPPPPNRRERPAPAPRSASSRRSSASPAPSSRSPSPPSPPRPGGSRSRSQRSGRSPAWPCFNRSGSLREPCEDPECRRSRRQLVELGIDAPELARPLLVAGLDLGPAHRQRVPHRLDGAEACPPRFRGPDHLEVDLDLEHLLQAAHERVPVLLVGIDERARPLQAGGGIHDLVAVDAARAALHGVLGTKGQRAHLPALWITHFGSRKT